MFTCDTCMFWAYREPNSMGVCTRNPANADGPVAPAAAMNVGIELAIEWQSYTATAPTTVCDLWDDGFEVGDFNDSDEQIGEEE